LGTEVDELRAEKNKINDEIATAENKTEIIEKGKNIKKRYTEKSLELKDINIKYNELILNVPNMSHPDSPVGKDEKDNREIAKYGKVPKFDFAPKTHEEIIKNLDLGDFERAAKVTGSKFYYLKNEGVLLELALVNFAIEKLIAKGFVPVITPDLARNEILSGIGFNPRGEESQIYNIENSELSLIGTAEITMGGYHMNEVLAEEEMPKKYAALSHCFRTEAGAYGKHSSGLYRVHQFTKVEMFACTKPEDSEKMHEEFKNIEVEIFNDLKIPFRVVDICTGDLGGPAQRKYDLEAWMTSKNDYGEVTSTSNTTDYQSRRLNIKWQKTGKTQGYAHLLNGTAIAVSRALIAILENYQQADGSVVVPEVLRKYMPGNLKIISKK
jgi:seryl-tRNA synthetase